MRPIPPLVCQPVWLLISAAVDWAMQTMASACIMRGQILGLRNICCDRCVELCYPNACCLLVCDAFAPSSLLQNCKPSCMNHTTMRCCFCMAS